jgi:hypothetical protein
MNLVNDSFSHLSQAVFASAPSDLFAMLTAYLDDSGTSPSNDVLVVAGYVGTVLQWKRFEKKRASLLSDHKVKIMHRADLENFKNEFENWNPDKRTKFVVRAQSIIRQHTYTAVGHLIVRREFEAAIPKPLSLGMGGGYGFCAYHCMKAVGKWCEDQHYTGAVKYVFEAGSHGYGQLNQILKTTHEDELDRGIPSSRLVLRG